MNARAARETNDRRHGATDGERGGSGPARRGRRGSAGNRRGLVVVLSFLGLVFLVYGARPLWTPLLIRFYVSRLDDDSYFDFDRRTDDYLPWPAYHRSVARLESFGSQAVDALLVVLDDDNARVRERALTALMRIGDRRAFAPAVRALVDGDLAVRQIALAAVRSFREDMPPVMIPASVSEFLASLDHSDAPSIRFLLDACLKDDDESVREAAHWALGQLNVAA